jgi:hypothetical protein
MKDFDHEVDWWGSLAVKGARIYNPQRHTEGVVEYEEGCLGGSYGSCKGCLSNRHVLVVTSDGLTGVRWCTSLWEDGLAYPI